jgi:hypothetical protein
MRPVDLGVGRWATSTVPRLTSLLQVGAVVLRAVRGASVQRVAYALKGKFERLSDYIGAKRRGYHRLRRYAYGRFTMLSRAVTVQNQNYIFSRGTSVALIWINSTSGVFWWYLFHN